jgi:hypothetical protein
MSAMVLILVSYTRADIDQWLVKAVEAAAAKNDTQSTTKLWNYVWWWKQK